MTNLEQDDQRVKLIAAKRHWVGKLRFIDQKVISLVWCGIVLDDDGEVIVLRAHMAAEDEQELRLNWRRLHSWASRHKLILLPVDAENGVIDFFSREYMDRTETDTLEGLRSIRSDRERLKDDDVKVAYEYMQSFYRYRRQFLYEVQLFIRHADSKSIADIERLYVYFLEGYRSTVRRSCNTYLDEQFHSVGLYRRLPFSFQSIPLDE